VVGDGSGIEIARKVVLQLEEMGHEVLTRHLASENALLLKETFTDLWDRRNGVLLSRVAGWRQRVPECITSTHPNFGRFLFTRATESFRS
jgi:hypothetical protein